MYGGRFTRCATYATLAADWMTTTLQGTLPTILRGRATRCALAARRMGMRLLLDIQCLWLNFW